MEKTVTAEWLPIETAPKDGTLHLRGYFVRSLNRKNPVAFEVKCGREKDGEFYYWDGEESCDNFVLWAPMPESKAMTQTASKWHADAKELAEIINREAVKHDKASGSRFLNEEIATAHIEWFLAEFAQRISDATRILQTREIMACETNR